ncbi:MAG: hypothetical protein KAT34_21505 [Candidatus Aminicenantes bacterium]|nr:hypothetical protein [Candidatus Aminicenantes bacterium]
MNASILPVILHPGYSLPGDFYAIIEVRFRQAVLLCFRKVAGINRDL